MKHDKELLFFKLVAVSGILLYLYKVSQKSGGKLGSNPYGVNVNADKIVHLAGQFVPNEYRDSAKKVGLAVMSRLMH